MQTQAEASVSLVSSAAHQAEVDAYRNAPAPLRNDNARRNAERQANYVADENRFHPGDEYRHEDGAWQPVPDGFYGLPVPKGVRIRREFQF